MKIIHSVQFDEDEVQNLFELSRVVGEIEADTTTYTEADKTIAINDYTKQFKTLLSKYGHDCFTFGFLEGSKLSSVSDSHKPVAPSYE